MAIQTIRYQRFFPATIPGCAHTDLMVLGKIPDPFIGKNELEVQWIGDQDWEYVKISISMSN